MNIKVVANNAGIFAKVILAVQTIKHHCNKGGISLDSIDNIYFESRPNGMTTNLFDYVLDQEELPKYDMVLQSRLFKYYNKMFTDSDLPFFRVIFNKLKFNNSVLSKINTIIDESTLGVHIRLTDMNTLHGNSYGVRNFKNYMDTIDSVMTNNDFKNIFISSDNTESINKLIDTDYNIITNTEITNRNINEVDGAGYNKLLKASHLEEKFWVDSFLDMLSLAKCGELIKGPSSLSNTSIILSSTFKKVYYV